MLHMAGAPWPSTPRLAEMSKAVVAVQAAVQTSGLSRKY